MPLDAVCIAALAGELKDRLEGGRIDKVQQPERDLLLLSVRAKGENLRLLLSAGTGSARIHVTRASYENPKEAPMFCMLLRKHLVGARILSLYQPDWERMLILELETHDELGVSARKQLIVEMIGRSANVSLVGEDGRIIDCMRRADFAGDALRRMLPGCFYRLPPRQESKLPFFEIGEERLRELPEDRETPMDKWLLDRYSGLSPLICRELAHRCAGDWNTLPQQLEALRETVKAEEWQPTLLQREGKAQDFSFMSISQYGRETSCETYPGFSELLDAFYTQRDQAELRRRRSHELTRSIRTARDRLARKLLNQKEELKRTEDRETVRRQAELITANLYRLKKGDRVLTCQNYYETDCPEISIPLDALKTPQQNAAALFKEYNKLKGAKLHLTELIEKGEQQLDYLNSVLEELDRAQTERDLSEIRRELAETGYLKKSKAKEKDKGKAQAPLRFMTDDGFEVLVGRNNSQNDELTTRIARRTDWWLHTQKVHGSHVILRCEGQEPGETALEQAAALAVTYSQGREGGKIPVDYTMVRHVRKPSGAMPGKVIYTEYKTMLAQGDEALAERLKRP
ncbi:MAG: NFACT family protein [Oscillospiraceae bacterium]|jgi:predicted ribosome quality control (RQC) complex YloA/Tae2 family protein|nr:NFACT family protein [Oscillospiraceae bacterium]